MDRPERLLIAAVRRMPAMRREWGEAMLAVRSWMRGNGAGGINEISWDEGAWRGLDQFDLGATVGRNVGALLLALELLLGSNSEPSLIFMMWTIGQVGLVSGAFLGVLLAFGESGKAVEQISLMRVTLWGALSAAVFPRHDRASQPGVLDLHVRRDRCGGDGRNGETGRTFPSGRIAELARGCALSCR